MLWLCACADGGVGPPVLDQGELVLVVENLAPLDSARDGTYEAWVIDTEGTIRSAGRFSAEGAAQQTVTLRSPIRNPTDVMVTIEPPGDDDAQPSDLKVMGGRVTASTADLNVNRYVTAGIPLEEKPGTHVLFTPSDNLELTYPSHEDAGLWLFNINPEVGVADSLNPAYYLTFTPLTAGWTYEGWVVRDYGTADAVWFSYGKFEPDHFKKARSRDNTGLGPFSGQIDYEQAMPREIVTPGDDWVANPHDLPVPGGLQLPLDLNGDRTADEPSRYTHVITVEPWDDREEDPWMARPSFIRPYRNPIGEAAPHEPRLVRYHPDELPRGTARIEG